MMRDTLASSGPPGSSTLPCTKRQKTMSPEDNRRPTISITEAGIGWRAAFWLAALLVISPTMLLGSLGAAQRLEIGVGAYANPPKIWKNAKDLVVGFWPELLQRITYREKWRLNYVWGTWNQGLERLKSRQIDIMPDVAYTRHRARGCTFSAAPILASWSRIYAHRADRRIRSILDLQNRRIAALKAICRAFDLHCFFLELDDYNQVFKAIEEGRCDAGIANRDFANPWAGRSRVRMTPIIFQPINTKFAFSKGSPKTAYLVQGINDRVEALRRDGDSIYYRLHNTKYLETPVAERTIPVIPGRVKIVMIIVLAAAATGLVILLLMTAWNRFLQRQVDRVTRRLRSELKERQTTEASLQESLRRIRELEDIINKSPVIAFLWRAEEDWPVEYVSENIERLGYGVQDFLSGGIRFAQIIHHDDRQRVIDEVASYSAAGIAEFSQHYRVITRSGQVLWIDEHTRIRRNEQGVITHYQGTIQDVTVDKTLRHELEMHRRHLEEKIAERTRDLAQSREALVSLLEDVSESRSELEAANRKLQELDRLKSMFIASMSHELRTPLNSIIGFTDLILQGLSGDINRTQRDQLRRVYSASKHLLGLITDIIDLSKIEAGKIEVITREFDLKGMLKEAAEDHVLAVQQKGLTLRLDLPAEAIPMHTDSRRLLQCIFNLLSNAVKYTERGCITVSARRDGDDAVIEVADNGRGIHRSDLERIFQPFVRLDIDAAVQSPGTGLGLYLTQKIMEELLHGTISVESRLGRGSRFTLRLPRRLPAAGSTPGEVKWAPRS